MSYFGIRRDTNHQPTFFRVGANRNQREDTDQRPLNRIYQNGKPPTTKWKGPEDPIAAERKTKQLEPPPLWKSEMRKRKYGRMYEEASRIPDEAMRQATMNAIAAQERIELDKEISGDINAETVDAFNNWLLGLGKPIDHMKAGIYFACSSI